MFSGGGVPGTHGSSLTSQVKYSFARGHELTGRSWFIACSALLLSPLVVHWLEMAWLMTGESTHIEFGALDFAMMTASFIYAAAAGALMMMPRSAAAKGLVLIYSVLLSGIVGEIFFRAMHLGALGPRTPWPQVSRVMDIDTSDLPGLEPHVVVSVDRLGLRGPDVDLNSCDVKILCVGGSTTECLYVTDRKTWPWLVQDELHHRLGTSVFVGNAGRAGQFSLHHEYQLRHYYAAHEFNWVILLVGANDMAAFLSEDYDRQAARVPREALTPGEDYPSVSGPYYRDLRLVQSIGELETVYSVYEACRSKSAVVQDEQVGWTRRRREARQIMLRKHGAIHDIPTGLDAAIETYQDTVRRIINCCHENGQRLVVMTQPTIFRSNLSESERALLCQAFENGAYDPATLATVMDRYNAALLDVCRQYHVDCIDLASMLPKNTSVFYDDVHFNVRGCKQVARVLTDYLSYKITSDRP